MPGYCVLVCWMRSFSVVRGPYSKGWPGGAFFGDGVTRRCGCEGGRNRSGLASTRGLVLAFFRAVLVEVKLRRAFGRWSARKVSAEGGPRGRRNPGIGVGIVGCCRDPCRKEQKKDNWFSFSLLCSDRYWAQLVDLSRCGTFRRV